MKYVVVPQVYTIIAFGASVLLWPSLSGIALTPSAEGTPLYLIHPLFILEFSLWLSTAFAWFITFVFSLRNIRKQALMLNEVVGRNLFVVSLVLFTVIVALSGCVGYSESIYLKESGADDLRTNDSRSVTYGLPPRDLFWYFRAINGFGILVCEPTWIITVLWKHLSAR